MPPHSKPKRPIGPPPKSPTDLATSLVGLLLSSTDPGAAAIAIVEARRSGLGPSSGEVAAWIARVMNTTTASYAALVRVQTTLGEEVDLVDRIIDAAVRERRALPPNTPWTEEVVWTGVPEETRWQFVRQAVEDAADSFQVIGADTDQHAVLGRYFELVIPTLIPDPLARLEWWFEHARGGQ